MARAHMPIFTASCGRTRMIAGPPCVADFVLSVPAPTMSRRLAQAGPEGKQGGPGSPPHSWRSGGYCASAFFCPIFEREARSPAACASPSHM